MAKTKISEWSTTPASNTDIDGINIAEGCAPSGINDAIRDLMAQVRSWQSGASGDPFNGPMNGTIGATTAYSGAFTTLSASGTTTLSGLTASTALALDASKNVVSVANTGSGSNVLATSPTLVTPALGTPSSATLTNATGLPISTGVSGLGTGVATALGVAVGSAGAPVVNGGALGTPSSGTVTNLTGTASININGTVGATTPTTGAFTTTTISTSETLSYGTANGVTYLNGSKVLTSGSALTFDGTTFEQSVAGLYPLISVASSANNAIFGFRMNNTGVSGVDWRIEQGRSAVGQFNISAPSVYASPLYVISSAGTFQYWSTTSGEQMRLTSTGLGIGTSSPAAKLDVSGNAYVSGKIALGGTTITDNNLLNIQGSNAVNNIGIVLNKTNGTAQIWGVQNSGPLVFFDYTASAERMRLDSAGNLGLGVTPSAWNSNRKAIQSGNASFFSAPSAASYSAIGANVFNNSGGTDTYISSSSASLYLQNAGAHSWYTAASGTAGTAISFTQAMTLTANSELLLGTTTTGGVLRVYGATGKIIIGDSNFNYFDADTQIFRNGSGTERARIDSSGNLLVGTTSQINTTKTSIKGTSGTNVLGLQNSNDNNYLITAFNSSGTEVFRVAGTGNVVNTNNSYGALSDVKLKENIVDATPKLAGLMQVQVRNYNLIGDTTKQIGVVAQELEAVFPAMVDESPDRDAEGNDLGTTTKSVKYSVFVPILIKALQELKAEFDAYKASHP